MKKKILIATAITVVIAGIILAILLLGNDKDTLDDDKKTPETSVTTTTTAANTTATTTVATTTTSSETLDNTTTTPVNETESITTTTKIPETTTTTTITTTKKPVTTTTKPVVTTTKKPTTTTKKTTVTTTTTKKKTTTTTTTKKKTTTTTKKPTVKPNNRPIVTEILDVLFKDGHIANDFQIASGWSNGGVFDCIWTDNNIRFEDGVMKLIIDKMTSGNYQYSGAEYRTTEYYSYGLYEVEMKPIKNIGVVSSFFTYTGPSDNNPWDEIDIEFLGKDTTKVQFNYYTNGRGNHEYMYNLGFDASEEFHKYAFLWEEGKITWYVDGVAVHTAYNNIPVTPGKIMMNVWPGINVDGWLGRYDGNTPLTAEYKSMKFTPIDKL